MNSLRTALLLIVALVFAGPIGAAQKPPTSTNVTTTIQDYDSVGNLLLTRSDDYNGLAKATYSALDWRLSSIIISGMWQIYLGNQSLRTIYLTLSKPANGSPAAPAPDGYYSANVELFSQCFDQNNNVVSWQAIVPLTSNNHCSLGIDFASGRTKHKLVMSPTRPGTGWATVSCNSGDSSGVCNNWTIVPNTTAVTGNSPTVANLYRFAKNGSLIYIGSYYNTYRIDVTNP